ncbi:alpha/beta hydrolase [Streptomyces sp. NPDC058891]|uniref:alpha/beta hydrolase n=1 Tax=Streptomyces sp. NPDC058891 TaxID=3346667 RepID=UPI0036B2340B
MTEYTDHHGPEGLRTRGTIVIVPGRGETRRTYTRLGRRLAADAYRVRVIDTPDIDADDPTGSLNRFGARLAAIVEDTAAEEGVVHPVVVVAADTGATAVAAFLGRAAAPAAWHPDAVVLAGLPGHTPTDVGAWENELEVRTSCPTHRGTLTQDDEVRRGSLNDAVPDAVLREAYNGDFIAPALFLIGDADPLADDDALARTAKSQSRARLAVVRGAHHDVLNDLQHRSVAAEIVTFLETVRNDLVPLIGVELSAW